MRQHLPRLAPFFIVFLEALFDEILCLLVTLQVRFVCEVDIIVLNALVEFGARFPGVVSLLTKGHLPSKHLKD